MLVKGVPGCQTFSQIFCYMGPCTITQIMQKIVLKKLLHFFWIILDDISRWQFLMPSTFPWQCTAYSNLAKIWSANATCQTAIKNIKAQWFNLFCLSKESRSMSTSKKVKWIDFLIRCDAVYGQRYNQSYIQLLKSTFQVQRTLPRSYIFLNLC